MNELKNEVTNIEFTSDGSDIKVRFVLNPHRAAMCAMEKRMEDNDCEPLLVVDRDNPNVWWCDDYMFVIDQMCIDETEIEDAYNWALMVTECDKWWIPAESGVVYRTKQGSVIRARVSTMPCDEAHGQCTNDCEPIEL